jgi:oligopeptide/dipeptide ABC transporter ATP-binding protein
MTTPLLNVQDLFLYYRAGKRPVHAVDGVSFAIEDRGQAIGIVGESGSGKTSMATALMRMLPKNVELFRGSIQLSGRELTTLSNDQFNREIRWKKIAMVFQGAMNVLNPVVRVGEQVAETLIHDGMDKKPALARAEELLERVGLPESIGTRYPHELSGGQRQRVVIATALVMNPDLLILDEPTSALDVSVQAQIMNLLKDLKEDPGISMIFITHDIGLASDLCDSIAVAYAGQQVEFGPADRVLVEPHHPYSSLLLSSLPRLHDPEPPTPMPGEPPDLSNPPNGCRFHPRCPYVFDPCPKIVPAEYDIGDGGHARCFLNDPDLAGDRYRIHLPTSARHV